MPVPTWLSRYGDIIAHLPMQVVQSGAPSTLYYAAYGVNTLLNTTTSFWSSVRDYEIPEQYPHVKTNVTSSGHIVQYNDTPAGERVLIKHRTGTGIDMLPDGSIEIVSVGNGAITIRGDMAFHVTGNMKLKVDGNYDVDVTGDYSVSSQNHYVHTKGNLAEAVRGARRAVVTGNHGLTVKSNSSITTLGTQTTTTLGNTNQYTKGTTTIGSEGDFQLAGGGEMKVTAETKMVSSSPVMQQTAINMTIIGATGTIGGEGIYMYGDNIRALNSVHADTMEANTFHGSLDGTAKDAEQAATAGGLGPVTIGPWINVAINDDRPIFPDAGRVGQVLRSSANGIVEVEIDPDDEIYNMIDRTEFTGGLSRDDISTDEVRSRMHDPANRNNGAFTAGQVSVGTLSPNFASGPQGLTGRSATAAPNSWRSPNPIGGAEPNWITPAGSQSRRVFAPDADHWITSETVVTPDLELWDGIPLSTFTGESTINHILEQADRQQLARNLQHHAWYLSVINKGALRLHTFKVERGVYVPGPEETPTAESVNDLAMDGRAVVYRLVNDQSGATLVANTYDLAVYLKDFIPFDRLILNYDTYDPSGYLEASIIIETPEVPEGYGELSYRNIIETRYNGIVIASGELHDIAQLGGNRPGAEGGVGEGGVTPGVGGTYDVNPGDHRLDGFGLRPEIYNTMIEVGRRNPDVTFIGSTGLSGHGSGRHSTGQALDFAIVQNGRRLNVNNPQDRVVLERVTRDFIEISRANGFNPAVGAANHIYSRQYMGGEYFHWDLSGRGYFWANDGEDRGQRVPDWLERIR